MSDPNDPRNSLLNGIPGPDLTSLPPKINPLLSSNGCDKSAGSTRESSPLPPKQYADILQRIPASQLPPGAANRPRPPPASNILLSQPQEGGGAKNALFSPHVTTTLVTSSPANNITNVHLVGPTKNNVNNNTPAAYGNVEILSPITHKPSQGGTVYNFGDSKSIHRVLNPTNSGNLQNTYVSQPLQAVGVKETGTLGEVDSRENSLNLSAISSSDFTLSTDTSSSIKSVLSPNDNTRENRGFIKNNNEHPGEVPSAFRNPQPVKSNVEESIPTFDQKPPANQMNIPKPQPVGPNFNTNLSLSNRSSPRTSPFPEPPKVNSNETEATTMSSFQMPQDNQENRNKLNAQFNSAPSLSAFNFPQLSPSNKLSQALNSAEKPMQGNNFKLGPPGNQTAELHKFSTPSGLHEEKPQANQMQPPPVNSMFPPPPSNQTAELFKPVNSQNTGFFGNQIPNVGHPTSSSAGQVSSSGNQSSFGNQMGHPTYTSASQVSSSANQNPNMGHPPSSFGNQSGSHNFGNQISSTTGNTGFFGNQIPNVGHSTSSSTGQVGSKNFGNQMSQVSSQNTVSSFANTQPPRQHDSQVASFPGGQPNKYPPANFQPSQFPISQPSTFNAMAQSRGPPPMGSSGPPGMRIPSQLPPLGGQPPKVGLPPPAAKSQPGFPEQPAIPTYSNPPTMALPKQSAPPTTSSSLTSRRYPTQPQPTSHPPMYNAMAQPQPNIPAPIPQPQFRQPQQQGAPPPQWGPPGGNQKQPPSMYQPNQATFAPPSAQPANAMNNLNQQFGNMNVTQTGFNRIWGGESVDLIQNRHVLPPQPIDPPRVKLAQETLDAANCHPEIFRCTMTKIPESNALLNKSRLPLGVLIHPFKDLNYLPVIQCTTIVRCRACRTYINPFVYFVDSKRWKCNLCYRVNELPEEFLYDPVSKSYGDPSRRPEIKSSTIEYIAPQEYMLRPPQPSVYLFLLDVSSLAIESGYLRIVTDVLLEEMSNMPGDSRTQIGFLCYNSSLHFYSLSEGVSQPHEMTVVDIDDIFLPCPETLIVNMEERKDLIRDLLAQLSTRFLNSHDNGSALGAALQAAFKLMSPTGGRVTVFQCTLPTVGPGSLTSREVPSQRSNIEVAHLNPATDFYKRLALDCSAHQIAVDLFILNSQYVDISTISGISKFSAGCVHHWPLFKASRVDKAAQFENCLRRYLVRKIGYEAVMRIRCTRGLAIHTFHGNFFVRSTDLLSLPNCNPDSAYGMQVSIEESLSDIQSVCFQAALLYTSSKAERRIRVHTLCLPIASTLTDVLNSADQQCIVGLVAKMAVDRSFQSSLSDARDAFINVVIDVLSAYKVSLNQGSSSSSLLAPTSLKLLPLYIVALLKYTAFRTGQNTRLDDRVFAMNEMKTLPLVQLIQAIYPDFYPIHSLSDEGGLPTEDGRIVPQPPRLQLSAEKLTSLGAFLLDSGHEMIIYVGHNINGELLNALLGFPYFAAIPDECFELPKTGTPENDRLQLFVNHLNEQKPYAATIQIIRDNSPLIKLFTEKLIEDRIETALSYHEFLQHLKTHVK